MKQHATAMMASALAVGVGAMALPARADEHFPSHPIQMIVPTPPGGGTDVAGRLLASLAEAALGQKVIVLNKPGAGGAIGVETMLQAKPDGYTIAQVWNSPITVTPLMFDVNYKPDSYRPIVLSDVSPTVYCVMKDFPATTGQQFLQELKNHPGKYTYGTDGVSGTVHLAAELIFSHFGIHERAIPYGGAGETVESFIGRNVDIYGGSTSPILPFVQNGTAKCLMVSTDKRSPALPDAASVTDLGIPDDATVLWHAIIAPAGVPPDRIAILQNAFEKAAQSQKYREFAAKQGEEAVGLGPADARKLMDKEYENFSHVIAQLGLNAATRSAPK
jgi:tripartite-type tricarboxylate transporter receptor subunit TctC